MENGLSVACIHRFLQRGMTLQKEFVQVLQKGFHAVEVLQKGFHAVQVLQKGLLACYI